ncbi:sugar phosphate isomerase/epimerase family protein [Devosia lacusdianchii]|uniref:sugar phosphate isomerase/epimerase family protein n=1 Tax=Devosia lacusdianchii TaxID=2917991 RepID=UPI001F060C66|nr:sugar phosphate isomerase/epimerase family protein [Devosia sp. JXJ CY 41]
MTDHQSPGRPMARLSLKWSMIEEPLGILEKFQLVKDLGFDGVELDAPNDLPVAEIIAARDKTGLAIPGVVNSLHWKYPLTHPDPAIRQACIDATITALEDARRYGADSVLLVPGVVNADTSYKAAYERAVEGIGKLLPHVDATGVSLALENVWNDFLLSPLEAARLVDEFDHPLVGWYFDVGNVLRYGRPAHWIEALGSRIRKVDIKEFSLTKMNVEGPWKGFEVELGEGDCDWPAVNRALSAAGYSGWASAEVPGGDRQRLADIKARLDRVAAA